MNTNKSLILEVSEGKGYTQVPEYMGVAKIVSMTDPVETDTQFGKKVQFRYILEIPVERVSGANFTINTKPMASTLNIKSTLYKFCKDVLGEAPTGRFDVGSLVGKYVDVVIQHVESNGKTYSNLISCRKARAGYREFNTTYKPKASDDSVAEGVQELEDTFFAKK